MSRIKVTAEDVIKKWHICVMCNGNGFMHPHLNPNKVERCHHCDGEGSFVY